MCFSATASFSASALLAVTGAVLVYRGFEKKYLAVALVPFLFAIQQFSEGLLWLNPENGSIFATFFAFFALCFWPAYIPFAMYWIEEERERKIDIFCFGIGIALTVYYLTLLPYVEVADCEYTIRYLTPDNILLTTVYATGTLYLVAAITPLVFSKIKGFRYFGVAAFIAAIVTFWIDSIWFISLWCFIAAIFSLSFFFLIPKKRGLFDFLKRD